MSEFTFTWLPDMGASMNVEPNIDGAKYGDGYEQRVGLSINSQAKKWSVTFTKSAFEASAILAFLSARNAADSFNWTDPMDSLGTYVCKKWQHRQINPGIYQVTGDFEQVFE